MVTAGSRRVVHFERTESGVPRAAIVPPEVILEFDPPGIELDVSAFFGER